MLARRPWTGARRSWAKIQTKFGQDDLTATTLLLLSALSSPHSPPALHEAASDCLISLLGRIEREECGDLEQSTVSTV